MRKIKIKVVEVKNQIFRCKKINCLDFEIENLVSLK